MLKIIRHHHDNIEEVYPINGIYKVYELDAYELIYYPNSPIIDQTILLEDIPLNYSIFKFSHSEIRTIKPEQLFIDCFGFASLKINNEIFHFNILIEKLKKNDAEDMLMYLWRRNKSLYEIFLSRSSTMASNTQGNTLNITSKFINYANAFYNKMLANLFFFESLPYYVLRPQNEVLNYSANLIDADSIPWILENLDVVSFNIAYRYDPDAIDFDGTYGIIDQVLAKKQKRCYNTYENNIILGSFSRLINKLNSLKKEINNNIDITRKYSDNDYVDFRDLKKIPYIHLLKETVNIKRNLEKLYSKYQDIFSDAHPQIERPKLTPVFINRRHYASIFKLIQKAWNIQFDFQGDMLLFNIQKMSHLYEIYNFYLLSDIIEDEAKKLGFSEIHDHPHNCDAKCLKIYTKNKSIIKFYYEPSYYTKQTEIDLIRIDNDRGTYYKPDFLLELISPDRDKVYCILDAKYSRQGSAIYKLHECIDKYILKTGIYQNPHKKIDYLFNLAPIDNKTDYIINHSYFPQIGILPSKPSNIITLQETISLIIKNLYE